MKLNRPERRERPKRPDRRDRQERPDRRDKRDRPERPSLCLSVSSSASIRVFCLAKQGGQDG